ncbi:prohormone-4 [Plakobranchus ocellatus]|uniref:Prohormone-4 n=1 Tax=Plakobranchus ocellatus TaxID=259542 RepID=A0AAV4B4A5_9GAST|nr:prohormone-4 [Plakobranchus ocellatus]
MPYLRLEVGLVTLAAVMVICAQGLKIDFSRLALNRPSLFTQKRNFDMECAGNPCPSGTPFPCKTGGKCIALKFICDGTWDCDDGFDEDPNVCNAASRPSVDDFLFFVENEKHWLVPKLFNGADPELIAHALSVASDMQDLADQTGMTQENINLLRTAFEAALEGDERPLQDMGMPTRSWHEVQYVLSKLLDSGFKV